jgi:hypothetical protein
MKPPSRDLPTRNGRMSQGHFRRHPAQHEFIARRRIARRALSERRVDR